MNKQQFNEALCFIDADLVEGYIRQDDALKKSAVKKSMWLRVGAVAACLCIAVAAVFALPMMLRDDPPPVVVEDTTSSDTPTDTAPPADTTAPIVITDPNTPPKAPILDDHIVIKGATSATVGNTEVQTAGVDYYMASPGFYAGIVIEAEVIEVLPDVYYLPTTQYVRRIARLKVISEINGSGLPDEIYYIYPNHDETIFENYDTFIFSIEQIGIENYVLLNSTQNKIEFFPHMFASCTFSDPSFGSVLAFNNGVLDANFWRDLTPEEHKAYFERYDYKDYYITKTLVEDPGDYNKYPARIGDTLQEVKQKIIDTIALKKDPSRNPYTMNFHSSSPALNSNYVTADKIFNSEERKQLREFVSPSEKNVFYYTMYVSGRYTTMNFYRLINGCKTFESIDMTRTEVIYDHAEHPNSNPYFIYEKYTPEQLEKVPDISCVISQLDLTALTPPHITLDEKTTFRGCEATGWYRTVDGNVYGIVRIYWVYDYDDGTNKNMVLCDDMYYLYDSDGNGRIVERDELISFIGDSGNMLSFKYEPQYEVWVDY